MALRGAKTAGLRSALLFGLMTLQGLVKASEPTASSAPGAAASPKVLVLSLAEGPPLPGESATLAASAERAVARAGRFTLLPLQAALDPEGAAERRLDEEAAATAFRQGQASYDDLDGKKAVAQLDRAVKRYEQTDLSLHFEELAQAWVMRIAAQVANGDSRGAHQEMEKLLAVDPRAEFSARQFSPEDLARVAQLRRESLAGGPARLSVQSSPVSARVYLDGQFKGVAPVNLFGLTPGEHFLTLVAPGYQLFQQRVRGGSVGATLQAASGLPRYQVALGQLAQASTEDERLVLTRRLAKGLGADQCLLALLRRRLAPGQRDLLLVRSDTLERGRAPRGWRRAVLDTAEPLAPQLEAPLEAVLAQDGALPLTPALLEEDAHPAAARGGLHVSPGMALLGAGAALLLGGVTFGVLAAHENRGYRDVQSIGLAAAHPYEVRGRRDAVLSDVLGGAGIVSLGLGSYLTWFGPSATPAITPSAGESR